MKATVEIPKSVVEKQVIEELKSLQRRLDNAEKRAENWKTKYKKEERSYEKLKEKTGKVISLAIQIGEAVDMREDYYDY